MDIIACNQWVESEITVSEGGREVVFTLDDCFRYHGRGAVGGVVLGFRLLQRLAEIISPQQPLNRRDIALFSSFPGLGVRDVLELITRMVSEQRITVDVNFQHSDIPAGVRGSFYFRFSYQGQCVELAPIKGAPSEAFIAAGRACKQQNASEATLQRFEKEKIMLANTLLTQPAKAVIREIIS